MSQRRQAQMFKKHEHSIIPSQKDEMDDHAWLQAVTYVTDMGQGKVVVDAIKAA